MPAAFHSLALNDPRLEPYQNLKRTNHTRWSGRFIAEGEKVVERLLESRLQTDSVLVAEDRLPWIQEKLQRREIAPPCFVLPSADCHKLVGFEFHQGVLACGIRPIDPALDDLINTPEPSLLVIASRITDADNVGTLFRLAAGLGARGVILGVGTADPYSRRALRVSMGAALHTPAISQVDIPELLHELNSRGVETIATVLAPDALPLDSVPPPRRGALLFGNEGTGLTAEEIGLCDKQVTIPMAAGTDSLNVATAAAIFLYHLSPLRQKQQ